VKPHSLLMCAIALVGAVFSIHLTSCSLAGLGIGALIDSGPTRFKPAPQSEFITISRGDMIELVLADSSHVSGHFEGWAYQSEPTYAARYDPWRARASGPQRPPALGAHISAHGRFGDVLGEFAGWGFRSVCLSPDSGKTLMQSPVIYLDSLSMAGGEAVPRDSLNTWLTCDPAPARAELVLESGGTRHNYAAESVVGVGVPRARHAKAVGFLIGATLDVIWISQHQQKQKQQELTIPAGCESLGRIDQRTDPSTP
jgi:hypothetical protein